MKSRSRFLCLSLFLAPLCTAAPSLCSLACSKQSEAAAKAPIADKPLAPYQIELLDIAFKSASAFPLHPHIKNRSRVQETVVDACFELEQPLRALSYAEQIGDWRRGAVYADFSFYCAKHGDSSQVDHYLDLANKVCEKSGDKSAEDSDSQDWRRDRIRSKIARTYLLLGRTREAAQYTQGLVDSETGRVEALRATLIGEDAFNEQLEALALTVKTGNFDQVRNALETYAQLFGRFYSDSERRSKLEERLEAAWSKLPIQPRVEVVFELIQSALDHQDPAKALELVGKGQSIIDAATWTPEFGVPLRARMAGLRHRAGDPAKAHSDADQLLALYESQQSEIVNIYRAGTLRPLAEAYQTMGDSTAALKIYKRAVEAGVENPNSRPRAEDLAATCCSMAAHQVEPDAELRARLREICDGLKDPW